MDQQSTNLGVLPELQQLSIRSEQYKQAGLTAQALTANRRSQAAEASRSSRDQVLRAKRWRHAPYDDASFGVCHTVQPESPPTRIRQLVESISAASTSSRDKHKAVRALRQLLSSGDAPLLAAAQAGAGSCLAKCLVIRQYSAVELKTVFEAAWAITNMAAGPPESVAAVLPTAPMLILLLRCTSKHVAGQSAWALGNMAGESAAVRSRLQANGAAKPLLHLLLAAQDHPDPSTLAAACTAAWALSNLLQDQSHAVKEVFAVAGAAQGLIRLLASSSSWDLLVETAWVLCHATHSQTDANRLVHRGLIQAVMQQIRVCTLQAQSGEEGVLAVLGLLTPLLRTIANVAALGGHDACSQLLSTPACDCIIAMAEVCLAGEDAGLKAEAARLCASIAAMPCRKGEASSHKGKKALQPLLPALLNVFVNGGLHTQREAAYAFANLLAAPESEGNEAVGVAQMLVQEAALAALQTGLRSPDQDLVLVLMHLVGMVSTLQPECRSGLGAVLAEDLAILARDNSPIQGVASHILKCITFIDNAMRLPL